jgi:hypothetical protein
VAAVFQTFAQWSMVVNLAVEDQPNAIGAAMHWLMTRCRKIDNRETPETESPAAVVENQLAGVIRAAVRHHIAHRSDQRWFDIAMHRSILPDSTDTTHS